MRSHHPFRVPHGTRRGLRPPLRSPPHPGDNPVEGVPDLPRCGSRASRRRTVPGPARLPSPHARGAAAWGRRRDTDVANPRQPGDDGGRRMSGRRPSPGPGPRPQASPPGTGDGDARADLGVHRLSPGSTPPMTTNIESERGDIPRSFTPPPPVDRWPEAVGTRQGRCSARVRRGAADLTAGSTARSHRRPLNRGCSDDAADRVRGAACAVWAGRGSMGQASPRSSPVRPDPARSTARV